MMDVNASIVKYLEEQARLIRIDILDMIYKAKSGHPGGSLSAADIVTTLYFNELRVDPANPKWPDRDRFVLSKGHACPVMYAALAERGFLPKEVLSTLRQLGSILQGHPDMKKVPGVEMSTGTLGQGLSVGVGMALGGKLDKKEFRVYVLLGDGETQEGQVWEAAMSASKYKLDNLTAIVDYNRLQVDGFVDDVMPLEPLVLKWEAFGWHVLEIDGHNIAEILKALSEAKNVKHKPTCIIAHTIKGKGVSFMENKPEWHGKAPNEEQYKQALIELGVH
ncbi:MAG: transketolase [Clostridiales bacterium]|jgi:transketolase|nr:transketolase [Clostridiales bacterium]